MPMFVCVYDVCGKPGPRLKRLRPFRVRTNIGWYHSDRAANIRHPGVPNLSVLLDQENLLPTYSA